MAILLSVILVLIQPTFCNAAEDTRVQLSVGQPGKKSASFSVGQQHRWYIHTDIYERLEDISGITFFQTLSPSLQLDTQSVSVKLTMRSGEETLLRMEEHYVFTAGSVFVEEGLADRLSISLTKEGLDFLYAYGEPSSELQISYLAEITAYAPMGSQILGSVQMNITDSDGYRWIYQSDKAAVSAGGFHIRLSDPEGKPICGGEFMLAKAAEQKQIEDPSVLTELLDTGEDTIAVVYVPFYVSNGPEPIKTDVAETNEHGSAKFFGLAYGDYYLVQMADGQEGEMLTSPVKIKVNEASHLTAGDGWKDSNGNTVDNTVCVTGTALVLPQTGGRGAVPYTLTGILLILCACLLLWYNREKGCRSRTHR